MAFLKGVILATVLLVTVASSFRLTILYTGFVLWLPYAS
jgi:hypothetical protein